MNITFNNKVYSQEYLSTSLDPFKMAHILELTDYKYRIKILDLGCGNGLMMDVLRSKGCVLEGIDIAPSVVRTARKKGFTTHQLSLEGKWAHKITNKFDLVMASEIIEHIFDTDRFLEEIRKVLTKNGELIITTPNVASLGRRALLLLGKNPILEITARKSDVGHIRYFTRSEMRNLVSEHGFVVDHLSSTVVNFDRNGKLRSTLLAKFFPQIGNNIVLKAHKE